MSKLGKATKVGAVLLGLAKAVLPGNAEAGTLSNEVLIAKEEVLKDTSALLAGAKTKTELAKFGVTLPPKEPEAYSTGPDLVSDEEIEKALSDSGFDVVEVKQTIASILNSKDISKSERSAKLSDYTWKLNEAGVSTRIIETLVPIAKIKEAKPPLENVVVKEGENIKVTFESLGYPEKITKENFREFAASIIMPRSSDEGGESKVLQDWNYVLDTIEKNHPDLIPKIITSFNLYIEQVRTKPNKYVYKEEQNQEGQDGILVNPYLLERGFTRTAYILEIIETDPNLNDTMRTALLADFYMLLVALGEDVSGASMLIVDGEGNKDIENIEDIVKLVYTVVPIDKTKALALANIGIELPIELIEKYGDFYEEFIADGEKNLERVEGKPEAIEMVQKSINETNSWFDALTTKGKIKALDWYSMSVKGEEKVSKRFRIAKKIVKMIAGEQNYIDFLTGKDLRGDLPLAPLKEAKWLAKKVPGLGKIINDDYLSALDETGKIAITKARGENKKLEIKSKILKDEIEEKRKLLERLKLLV